MDQPAKKVATPAEGQLNRENKGENKYIVVVVIPYAVCVGTYLSIHR